MKKRLKKLASLFLAVAMIVLMLPEISFADEEELMDAIYLTVDADAWTLYRVGEDAIGTYRQLLSDVVEVRATDRDKYYVNDAILRYGSEMTQVSYGDAIMADTQYYYQFSVRANSGYSFNSDKEQMSVYINDVKVTPQSIYYNEYWDLYNMIVAVDYAPAEKLDTTIINSVTFESGVIEQPAIGQAAQSVVENKYSTFYSISNMSWTSSTDDGFKAGDTFTGGATYTLSLVLTPEEGYEFKKNENSEYSGTFYVWASSDGRSVSMDGSDLIIEMEWTFKDEVTDIYLTADYEAWTTYVVGNDINETDHQLRYDVQRSGETDKYTVDSGNSGLFYLNGTMIYGIGQETEVCGDKQYILGFNVKPSNGYSFNGDAEKISVYLNGVKVTPREISYNPYWKSYRIYFDAPAPAEKKRGAYGRALRK